jgi:hypothetical protein
MFIPEEGISVSVKQSAAYFGNFNGKSFLDKEVDYFKMSITYADKDKEWLTGVPDISSNATSANNWLLSGFTTNSTGVGTANERENSDIYFDFDPASPTKRRFVDSSGMIAKGALQGWAPYCFTSNNIWGNGLTTNPVIKGSQPAADILLQKIRHRDITKGRYRLLANVDLVLTNDRSKWSRCPVIELGNRIADNQGNVFRHKLRSAPTVDQDGNVDPNPPAGRSTGMGWFPGYAINLSTGERLNIVFGEDSRAKSDNGRDMVWNPTNVLVNTLDAADAEEKTEWGGKHYVYIFGHNGDTRFDNTYPSMLNKRADVDKYDEGESIYEMLKYTYPNTLKPDSAFAVYKEVWKDAMYVGLPLIDSATYVNGGFVDLTNPKKITIPTETRISFRVNEPFKFAYRGVYGQVPYSPTANFPEIPTSPAQYSTELSGIPNTDPEFNGNLASYTFSTEQFELPTKVTTDAAKEALNLINVVPNPYLSVSEYERLQLDNIVKITNLPEKCTVKIYTMNGQLVREFNVDNTKNKTEYGSQNLAVDWDLKNFNNIPISSGLYLIHVSVPNVGEKVVKWFGTIRPTDLSNF